VRATWQIIPKFGEPGAPYAVTIMADSPEIHLKRRINLPMLLLFGLGTILGAGIYVLVGEVAGKAGMLAPWSFLLAALIAGFSSFSFAEFSSRLPLSAGEAAYVNKAFARAWLSGLVGLSVAFSGIVSAATIIHGFLGYLSVFVAVPLNLGILLLVLILAGIAAWGIGQSVITASLITLVEISGLLFVVACGADHLQGSSTNWDSLLPALDEQTMAGIGSGAFIAFFAFLGFEDMVNEAEEVVNPRRNLPIAIILALAIGTSLYMLVALVAVLAVEPARLQGSSAPLAIIIKQSGYPPEIITIISLFAVINGALIQLIMASRVMYGMAGQNLLPKILARINRHTQTPLVATSVAALLILGFAWWLPLLRLAEVTTAFALFNFTLVNLALLKVKLTYPAETPIFEVPIWVPAMGALLSAAMAFLYFL